MRREWKTARTPPISSARLRCGLTLVEMLLVLGVLSALIAMAWPSILRLHGEQKITEAAEKVRTLIAATRVHAIESGLAYQFRFEPNGGHFISIPFEKEFESVDPNSAGATAEGVGRFSRASGTLPEKIVFTKGQLPSTPASTGAASTEEAEQKLSSEMFEGLPNADELGGAAWSGPIVFQQDGSATDAEVTIVDSRNQRISLRIRGLTGAVAVGRIYREDAP